MELSECEIENNKFSLKGSIIGPFLAEEEKKAARFDETFKESNRERCE